MPAIELIEDLQIEKAIVGGSVRWTGTRRFLVTGHTDPAPAVQDADLPSDWAPWSGTSARVTRKSAEVVQSENASHYIVTVEYETPDDVSGEVQTNDEEWSWRIGNQPVRIKAIASNERRKSWRAKTQGGACVINTLDPGDGTAIRVKRTDDGQLEVDGRDVLFASDALTVTKYVPSLDVDKTFLQNLQAKRLTVNDASWPPEGKYAGFAGAGEAILMGVEIRDKLASGLTPVVFQFRFSPTLTESVRLYSMPTGSGSEVGLLNPFVASTTVTKGGWQDRWFYLRKIPRTDDGLYPIACHVDTDYPEADWTALPVTGATAS